MNPNIIQQFALATRGLPQQARNRIARDTIIRVLGGQVAPAPPYHGQERDRPDAPGMDGIPYGMNEGGNMPQGIINQHPDFFNRPQAGAFAPAGGAAGFAGAGFGADAGFMPAASGPEPGFAGGSSGAGEAAFRSGPEWANPLGPSGGFEPAGYAGPDSGVPAQQPPVAGGETAAKEGAQAKGEEAEEEPERDPRCDFGKTLCRKITTTAKRAVSRIRDKARDVQAARTNPQARVLNEVDTYFGKGGREHLAEIAARLTLMANRLEKARYVDGSDTLGTLPTGRVQLLAVRKNSTDTMRVNVDHLEEEMRKARRTRERWDGVDWNGVVLTSLIHEAAHLADLRGHEYFKKIVENEDVTETTDKTTVYGRKLARRLARERGYASTSKNASNYACFVIGRGQNC